MQDWFVRNFTQREVACPCCGVSKMAARTMLKFQKARDFLGVPIYGTSWCRCEEYNRKVGGVPNSSHLFGDNRLSCAGDVTLVPPGEHRDMTSSERYNLYDALREANFERLGSATAFIHADDDQTKAAGLLWLY